MVIKIKDTSKAEWSMFGQIHPKLAVIFFDFVNKLKDYGVNEVDITSILRSPTFSDGSCLHTLGRAIDVDASFSYSEAGQYAMKYINHKYVLGYDSVVYKNTSQNPHYHIQFKK